VTFCNLWSVVLSHSIHSVTWFVSSAVIKSGAKSWPSRAGCCCGLETTFGSTAWKNTKDRQLQDQVLIGLLKNRIELKGHGFSIQMDGGPDFHCRRGNVEKVSSTSCRVAAGKGRPADFIQGFLRNAAAYEISRNRGRTSAERVGIGILACLPDPGICLLVSQKAAFTCLRV